MDNASSKGTQVYLNAIRWDNKKNTRKTWVARLEYTGGKLFNSSNQGMVGYYQGGGEGKGEILHRGSKETWVKKKGSVFFIVG